MAEKKPICNYSGKKKELQSGDTLPGSVTNGDSHDHSGGDGATIPIGGGGTGQTTAQAAIDALTAVSGATIGHALVKDADGHATWAALGGGNGVWKTQTFTASGTWTKPDDLIGGNVWLTGSGAGAGGAGGSSSASGGGGGAGAYCQNLCMPVVDDLTITIGAKGTGGAGNANGSNGGNTTITDGTTTITLRGGQGGEKTGVGGSGSPNGSNSNGALCSGSGAGSIFGPGGLGVSASAVGNAAAATSYGAGGSGGRNNNYAGGDGTDGVVIVTWQETA